MSDSGASLGQTPGGMTPGGQTPGGVDVALNSTEIASLTGQLEAARAEIEEWKAQNERNPEAAKLEAEKKELFMDNESLRKELKSSPESLTARIKGLNDLTNDLNAYLKMYCMESIKELKEELESTKASHSTKV